MAQRLWLENDYSVTETEQSVKRRQPAAAFPRKFSRICRHEYQPSLP
jgi:hypothetical protein